MGAKSRYFWHDLMTSDVGLAKKFYGELFGWAFKEDGGPQPYTHIMVGDVGIGGMMKLDPAHGAPPHWVGYLDVKDIDATLAAVTKNGGKILLPRTDVPEVGPFAIVADPQGAVFAPMHYIGKEAGKPEPDMAPMTGFCWDELATTDTVAATKFYAQVFGWGVETMEMPGFGTYTLLKRTGDNNSKGMERSAGGLMKLPPGAPPHPYWLSYIAVTGADATVEKAKQLGATILSPAMDIPDVGRFAVMLDPTQAAIAILEPRPSA